MQKVAEKDNDVKHKTGGLTAATAENKESILINTTKSVDAQHKIKGRQIRRMTYFVKKVDLFFRPLAAMLQLVCQLVCKASLTTNLKYVTQHATHI